MFGCLVIRVRKYHDTTLILWNQATPSQWNMSIIFYKIHGITDFLSLITVLVIWWFVEKFLWHSWPRLWPDRAEEASLVSYKFMIIGSLSLSPHLSYTINEMQRERCQWWVGEREDSSAPERMRRGILHNNCIPHCRLTESPGRVQWPNQPGCSHMMLRRRHSLQQHVYCVVCSLYNMYV